MSNFSNKISSLQNLCIETQLNAIVLIFGNDGRSQLKYFSKYLFNCDSDDDLDELILIIQPIALTVFLTKKNYEKIGTLLNSCSCSCLIRYLPSQIIEENIDIFEFRKCTQFKRMVMEALGRGATIGIPLPKSYDSVMEIETWPLMKAFALDSLLVPTGFFTARFRITDITTSLESLYRTIDSAILSQVIYSMNHIVIPQSIAAIKSVSDILTQSVTPRKSDFSLMVTLEAVEEALYVIYEYGRNQVEQTLDHLYEMKEMKPRVLIGPNTNKLFFSNDDNDNCVDLIQDIPLQSVENSHDANVIAFEGLEPHTGIRWCRTVFLTPDMSVPPQSSPNGQKLSESIMQGQLIYDQLINSLRQAVTDAVAVNVVDVFLTVKRIEEKIHLICGKDIQIHSRLYDALGCETLADTHDKLGMQARFLYLRASSQIKLANNKRVTVSVGDTFLILSSICLSQSEEKLDKIDMLAQGITQTYLLGDDHCITHPIPYSSVFVIPNHRSQETDPKNTISTLGKLVEDSRVDHATLPVLFDSTQWPVSVAQIQVFTSGLVIQSNMHTNTSLSISFLTDVEAVWTLDIDEVYKLAVDKLSSVLKINNTVEIEDGLLFLIKLNEVALSKLSYDACKFEYIGLVTRCDSIEAGLLATARSTWRVLMRAESIIEHKKESLHLVPTAVLAALIVYNDMCGFGVIKSMISTLTGKCTSCYSSTVSGFESLLRKHSQFEKARLKNVNYNICKNTAITSASNATNLQHHSALEKRRKLVVVAGAASFGVHELSLNTYLKLKIDCSREILLLDLDVTSIIASRLGSDNIYTDTFRLQEQEIDLFRQKLTAELMSQKWERGSDNATIIVSVALSKTCQVNLNMLIELIKTATDCSSCAVICIQNQACTTDATTKPGLEIWYAPLICDSDACDILVTACDSQESIKHSNMTPPVRKSNIYTMKGVQGQLKLDADAEQHLLAVLQTSRPRQLTLTNSLNSSYLPVRWSNVYDYSTAIKCIRYDIPWETSLIQNITSVLKFFFPRAYTSNQTISVLAKTISEPQRLGHTNRFFNRLLHIAAVKVFAKRRETLSASRCKTVIHQLTTQNQDKDQNIRGRLLSIHGCIRVGQDQLGVEPVYMLIEANASSVLMKSLTDNSLGSFNRNQLIIQGLLDSNAIDYVVQVMQLLKQDELSMVKLKGAKDLNPEDLCAVQRKSNSLSKENLPFGWFYDGTQYVDCEGNHSANHPRSEDCLNEYIEKLNRNICRYNQLLSPLHYLR